MASFVRRWIESLNTMQTLRPPHHNPIPSDTAGMDQVNTSGLTPNLGPQPVSWTACEELAELKRRLTGRPHGENMSAEERQQAERRIEQLQDAIGLSPDDADAGYGLKPIPTINARTGYPDTHPSDINKRDRKKERKDKKDA